ncbi:MAG: hypothetical protein HGA97_12570 [Chlorobiaceae bacterium]|nr:hypothetical protein [Chlorobiaceae bacterium]
MSNKNRKTRDLISGILTCMLLAPAPAHAALIAYEGFDYVPGSDIRGQSGGSGWATGSSWAGYDPSATWPGLITSSGLSFGKLDIQGKALTTATTPGTIPPPSSALYWRNLPQFGQEGSTLYVSFLFRPEPEFGYYGGINLTDEFGNGIFVGKSGASGYNNYGLEGPLNDIESSGVPVATGETDLIILKAQFLAGNDIYSIFVNPALDGVEPGAASASKTDFDPGNPLIGTTFIFNNYGNYTIDEIRIGTTYADVTPIPEPGTLTMIAFGLSVIIGRNRIRRSAALNNLSF